MFNDSKSQKSRRDNVTR